MVHFKFDSENVFCLKMSHLAKSYKKKVVFTNSRNFKIFFRQIKISCCLQNISKFHIGQINHAWLRAFWKKKFQKFQKLGEKIFPHKIPQGPPQAGPLCLGVFPSCHNTFHQIWSNSSFLPFPPLLYRLSEFTLKLTLLKILATLTSLHKWKFWLLSHFDPLCNQQLNFISVLMPNVLICDQYWRIFCLIFEAH